MIPKKMQKLKQLLTIPLAVIMLFTLIPVLPIDGIQSVEAAETKLRKPRKSNGEITYDCVWFGSYPQAEVITTALLEKYEASVSPEFVSSRMDDFIIDNDFYQTLKTAKGWDANGDITLSNGDKYRRIKRRDVTDESTSYIYCGEDNTYHYFKYQPIKWRVLSTNKREALLLAENGLDCQVYHTGSFQSATWKTCTARSWLNGYGSKSNLQKTNYTKKNFINSAFNSKEKKAIKAKKIVNKDYSVPGEDFSIYKGLHYPLEECYTTGASTKDKIFLLSHDEAIKPDYGFSPYNKATDKAKQRTSTLYAYGMGAENDWVLRSSAGGCEMLGVAYDGNVRIDYMNTGYEGGPTHDLIVPALYLDLSAADAWRYAGTTHVEESRNGLAKENGKYCYYENDKKQNKYTGLVKKSDQKWYYLKKGVWQSKYTGMVIHSSEKWYYVENGLRKYTTGLVKHTDHKWWYVKNGEWQLYYTGMVKHSSGKWYYVKEGKKEYTTGLVKHTDDKLWYVKNGEWQPTYTEIVKHSDGKSYYIEKGRQSNITGHVTVNGKLYYLVKGEVK